MVKRKGQPKKDTSFAETNQPATKEPSTTKILKTKKTSNNKNSTNLNTTKTRRRKTNYYTHALREIRHLQRTTHLLIPRAPFLRLIRELMQQIANENFKITAMAVEAIREAAECYLISTMEDAYSLAIHAKRVTLFPRDIELVVHLRRDFGQDF